MSRTRATPGGTTNAALARARAELRAGRRQEALAAARRRAARNPLRRVLLPCHGWVQDSVAVIGDHVWCEPCADWARVGDVVE